MPINKAISMRIKELLAQRHMTQYALYKKSGVHQSTLSTIINCKFPGMKIQIIYEICEGLEISLKEFFDSPLFDRENIID